MKHAKPLPELLMKRYKGWKATEFEDNKAWFSRLADEGQRPRGMIISCCDSRVHVTSMFGAATGEFFVHRNIANLVPPHNPDGEPHGTSAAVEYAVKFLNVSNLLVIGHSDCGGIGGCLDMCSGAKTEVSETSGFIGRWMSILRPGYDRICDMEGDRDAKMEALEKQGVIISLENLLTFPFITEALENDTLAIHGLWNDISNGELQYYDPETADFLPV